MPRNTTPPPVERVSYRALVGITIDVDDEGESFRRFRRGEDVVGLDDYTVGLLVGAGHVEVITVETPRNDAQPPASAANTPDSSSTPVDDSQTVTEASSASGGEGGE